MIPKVLSRLYSFVGSLLESSKSVLTIRFLTKPISQRASSDFSGNTVANIHFLARNSFRKIRRLNLISLLDGISDKNSARPFTNLINVGVTTCCAVCNVDV